MEFKQIFPNWIWVIYFILFILSIPWYLPSSLAMNLVLGLPLWLISCILAILVMAFFTVFVIGKYWK